MYPLKSLTYLLLVCLLFKSVQTNAQNAFHIVEGPLDVISCDSNCTMIHGNFPKPLKTNQYAVSAIPFSPVSISGTNISVGDDQFSNAIPIGFNFCFFENVYTQCYVADNGVLTFNAAYNNAVCNSNTQQLLPYFNSTFPDNAVFFMFMDIDPSLGGTIKYATVGTAPLRKLVINYQNVKNFGATCSNVTSNYQVILYESTNIIEVHATNKTTCDSNPLNFSNYSTIGVQNQGATIAFTAPGKHASIFNMQNEALRIAPSGPLNYLLTWFDAQYNVIATNTDSIYVCPPYFPYSKITATISFYCPNQTITDTVMIKKILPVIDSYTIVKPFCNLSNSGIITIYSSGGTPPYTYTINNGIFTSNNVFTNISAGSYTMSVKDANGCRIDSAIIVTPAYPLTAILDSVKNPVCPLHNGAIYMHVVGSAPPYTITWSGGYTGTTLTGLAAGTYVASIVDANGCIVNLIVALINDSVPILHRTITKPVCHNAAGVIQITTTGGASPYHYSWSTGDTTATVSNLPQGYYNVTVTDIHGCSVSEVVALIDTLDLYTTSGITNNTSCNLNNGKAYVLPMMGLLPYTYLWTPSGQTTSTATNLPAGVYICKTTDANNCIEIDSFTILPSLATINNISSANANCDSSNGKIYLNGVQNATSPIQTLWNTGSNAPSIIGLPAGTYWVKTKDAHGCIDIDTITIVNDGKPFLGIVSYTSPLCFGDSTGSVTLTGTSGTAPYKYSFDGIQFTSFAQINNISGGAYTIYITDANSCPNDTVVYFTQPSQVISTFTTDTIICYADKDASISVNTTGGFAPYVYSFDNSPYTTQSTFNNLSQGVYTVDIKDSNNCFHTLEISVQGPDSALEILIEKGDALCYDTNSAFVKVQVHGGWQPYTYLWSNGFTGLELLNLSESNLLFEVTDKLGCKLEKGIDIKQEHCCLAAVPNAFSPNNDTKNDVLRVIPVSEVKSVRFSIFDRWGKYIFTTKDINQGWNGTYEGKDCEIGVYFYYLEYDCLFQKEKIIQKGDITLLR